MRKSERGDIDSFDVIIIILIFCFLFGIGPCADESHDHCKQPAKQQAEQL